MGNDDGDEREARLDAIQKHLVEDDEYRRLLFESVSQICSPDQRCAFCDRHSTALEKLYKRQDEIWPNN